MQSGDPLFLETNASRRRYHAAFMRSACVKPTPARYRALYDASRAGLEAALAAIRPGVAASTVDNACRAAIERAGQGDAFRLRTGYSVGLGFENFGEGYLFSLHAKNHAPLEPGMVLHIVPYLSEAGVSGAAVSETVIVTASGMEPVASLDRGLAERLPDAAALGRIDIRAKADVPASAGLVARLPPLCASAPPQRRRGRGTHILAYLTTLNFIVFESIAVSTASEGLKP